MSPAPKTAKVGVAPEIAAILAGRRFALFGFDPDETARISAILRKLNAITTLFEEIRLTESAYLGDVLLLKLRAVSPRSARIAAQSGTPLLFSAPGEVLLQGVAGAYGWNGDFLSEPWPAAELPLRLFRLLAPDRKYGCHAAQRSEPLVLIVDDDPAWVSFAEAVLRANGVACCAATDGFAALRFARQLLPDLLVLDLNIPGIDGLQVLETVRQDTRLAALPVAMLTGCDQSAEVTRASALHADDYLVKPLAPALLLKRIKRLLDETPGNQELDHPICPDWPFSAALDGEGA